MIRLVVIKLLFFWHLLLLEVLLVWVFFFYVLVNVVLSFYSVIVFEKMNVFLTLTLKMRELEADLKKDVQATSIIMMELPLPAQHTGHDLSTESCMSRRIHPKVRDKIHELVNSGIETVNTFIGIINKEK